ncbi:hypothetical protein AAF712_003965 [Marasmius tenuissimus]|uniref:Uncharacterized protein n=1 Tax=Marasmius tenuissimus TaxID=585030 RepID=A0ABR3A4T1_9AGAR
MATRTPSKQVRLATQPYPTPPTTPYRLRPGPRAKPSAIKNKRPIQTRSPTSSKTNQNGRNERKKARDEMKDARDELTRLQEELSKCRRENEQKDGKLNQALLQLVALRNDVSGMQEELDLLRELRPTAIRALEFMEFYTANLEDHGRLLNQQKATLTCPNCNKILNQPQVYVSSESLPLILATRLSILIHILNDLIDSTAVTFTALNVRSLKLKRAKYPAKRTTPFVAFQSNAGVMQLWVQFTTEL